MIRFASQLMLVLITLASFGCTTAESRSYPGYTPDQVWTAVLAVANDPHYSDPLNPTNQWAVLSNNTWVEEGNRRVEIYRELRRDAKGDGGYAFDETREWKFTVTVRPTNPPRVVFKIRNDHLPAHGWREEERFFDDLAALLHGPEGGDAVAAEPASP